MKLSTVSAGLLGALLVVGAPAMAQTAGQGDTDRSAASQTGPGMGPGAGMGRGPGMGPGAMGDRGWMGPPRGHGPMGPRGMMGGHMGPGLPTLAMIAMDANGDRAVSLEEFQAFHARAFKYVDANNDGKLTEDELRRFMSGDMPASP